MTKKNKTTEKKATKEGVAYKLIVHFFLENEKNYLAEKEAGKKIGEKSYVKLKTDQDIIYALQMRYNTVEDLKNENNEWCAISEKEYADIESKNNDDTWSGLDIGGLKFSDSTLDTAIRKLKNSGELYIDENDELHYAADSLHVKRKIYPILNMASQISIESTDYRFFRCFFIERQYIDAVATWLNGEFSNDDVNAYCLAVENVLIVFAAWQKETEDFNSLDKYLKELFKNAKFKYH